MIVEADPPCAKRVVGRRPISYNESEKSAQISITPTTLGPSFGHDIYTHYNDSTQENSRHSGIYPRPPTIALPHPTMKEVRNLSAAPSSLKKLWSPITSNSTRSLTDEETYDALETPRRSKAVLSLLYEPCRGGRLSDFLRTSLTFLNKKCLQSAPLSDSSGSSSTVGSLKRSLLGQMDLFAVYLHRFAQQVASGLAFLHEQGCMHTHVSVDNVYLVLEYNIEHPLEIPCDQFVKLGDYCWTEKPNLQTDNISIPPKMGPPESFGADGTFLIEGDVWQFGLLVCDIVSFASTPSLYSTACDGRITVKKRLQDKITAIESSVVMRYKCMESATVDRGLSINMFELHEVKQKYENKNIVGMEVSCFNNLQKKSHIETIFEIFFYFCCYNTEYAPLLNGVSTFQASARCEFELFKGNDRICLRIEAQSIVHPKASDALFSTLANRSLRINKSFPSLYNTYCHPGRKQSSLIYSGPEFCVDTLSEIVATTKPENCARKTTIDSDASPHFTDDVFNLEEQESHIKTRKRCQFDLREDECLNKTQSRCRAVLSGIPMLRAEMLNFDAVFE
uniref:Protein kinase domain-containing protein n=1 Tax=Heterorhabditis bacteriophora TaxID=37862 RepID=A0A1I7XFZ2_HETBA